MKNFQLKIPTSLLFIALCFSLNSSMSYADDYTDLLSSFTNQGASAFSVERGKVLWNQKHPAKNGGKERSCSLCHTSNLANTGKHIKTGKVIKPMAVSKNPDRLTKARKMKKWLLRNCKWVMGRTCTAQEKGDILSFIHNS